MSPYACDIPPWQPSGHRSHNLSLFPMPQLCISFLIKKRCGALGREQQTHILSVPVKLLSNCCRAAGGADICFSLRRLPALPFTKPGDATHILFVLHEQTDCKLADNFCTDNVIYGCQPFVCSVCFIQIWTEWTSPPPLTSALKSHQFTSILSYLKFIGGNHLVECPAVAMETKGPMWTSEGLGTCKI